MLGTILKAVLAGLLEFFGNYLGDLRKEAQLQKLGALEAVNKIQEDNADVYRRAKELDAVRSTNIHSAIDRL